LAFLLNPPPETAVVNIQYSGTPGYMDASWKFWRAQTQEQLARRIVLVTDSRSTYPVKVIVLPARRESGHLLVAFPRDVEGRPLLTPDMKEVYLEVADPNGTLRLRFDVRKMMVRGELVY
jgi:hypothetical protein